MEYNGCVAGLPNQIEAIPVELLQLIRVKLRDEGFIEGFDSNNNVLVFRLSVLSANHWREPVECVQLYPHAASQGC